MTSGDRCRCNNCMREFDDDSELELMQDGSGDWMRACPHCRTDEYLMDLEEGDDEGD